jgi:hypothetical protein
LSKSFTQEAPRDEEDSSLLLFIVGRLGIFLGGFCFVGGWSKRDIKVRFGSPHNPPAFFRRHCITQASFLAISAAISILMKPYG